MKTHATRAQSELLRFRCTLCGGCCEGVKVPVSEAEVPAIERAGAALGVAQPVDGRALRFEGGQCVFQAQGRCRIHGELGPERKPHACQQFPLIALRADDGLRIGVDPAAYGAHSSWLRGEPLPDMALRASRVSCPGGQRGLEAALVQACEAPEASVGALLALLCQEPAPTGGLPLAFSQRWAQHLSQLDFQAFLQARGPGPVLLGQLEPVASAAPQFSGGAPPWALSPESERWVVEATRRVLFLRLLANIPSVSIGALLVLGGALACAWTDPRPGRFEPRFTAWLRALRFDPFWQRLARTDLMWLATGQRGPI